MLLELFTRRAGRAPPAADDGRAGRSIESYELELRGHLSTELKLRAEIIAQEALLREKDKLLRQQEALREECDHRLMNSLQMIASLISLQRQESMSAASAEQLTVVADRVATIGRIHRHLHRFDDTQTIALKPYLEELCHKFSGMLTLDERSGRSVAVEAIDLDLPAASGVPLGFILNELITNAAKHGEGRITVRLERGSEGGYALSVANDGPSLPEGFDPAAGKGLGMKIVRSFVAKIGGELRIAPDSGGRGARFTVLFA